MKNYLKKTVLVLIAVLLTFSFTACSSGGRRSKDGKTVVKFLVAMGEGETQIYDDIVKAFNNENKDNIKVSLSQIPATSYNSALSTALASGNQDVVNVTDEMFKTYANRGYMTVLDDYVKNSDIDISDIYESAVYRYTYSTNALSNTAPDAKLYALPKLMNPTVMFYNQTFFDAAGINTISVEEDRLDEYNAENSAAYLPHGYYEYPQNYADAKLAGKKVFNNRIAMNWQESVLLSSYFTKDKSVYKLGGNTGFNCTYGFYTEWWFSYCWSVGGDCLEYDTDLEKNVFTLGDKMPNYLVTKPLEVNDTEYNSGDILSFMDKKYVYNNKSQFSAAIANNELYELPSQYDAFCEFLCLPVRRDGNGTPYNNGYVDDAKKHKAYEVSPNPTTMSTEGKGGYFSKGEIAMLVVEAATAYSISESMERQGFSWDVAPIPQYREYNADGTVKEVNGTEIVGKKSGFSSVYGWTIPSKSPVKDEAFKFIEYLQSEAVQRKLIKTGLGVPVMKSLTSEYLGYSSPSVPSNRFSVVDACVYEGVGDWAYLEDGDWVDTWSTELNTNVRNGKVTVDSFLSVVSPKVTKKLATDYKVKDL